MLSFAASFAAAAVAWPLPQEGEGLGALLNFMPGAMLWTWLAFLVALPVMWKMVYGPISKSLERRDQSVEDAIAAAEQQRQQAEQQMAAAKHELDKARAEGKRMVEEAVARAERQAKDALRAADEKAKLELQKASAAIAAEKRAALQKIRQLAVDLTITAAGKLLQQKMDDEANRRIVRDFVQSGGDRR